MSNLYRASIHCAVVLFIALSLSNTNAHAGRVEGHARFEKIKGKPNMGYVELYETNLFLSPASSSPIGPSRRLGTTCLNAGTCSTLTTHDGCYCIDNMPSGNYSMLVNQPLFFVAPKVMTNVVIPSTGSVNLNPELSIDYSTYVKNDWTATAHSVWYQTFVATGRSIRGVAFSFAGETPSYMTVAILADNGDVDVRMWPVIAERIEPSVGDVTDNWVRFRSVETPTFPGQRYAVRLMAFGANIQPYKRTKDSNSYSGGRAYDANGVAQNYDINVTVFSDNDGTAVTMNKRTKGIGDLMEGLFSTKWGHTFVARGTSLAAVDVWAAGAEHKWDLDFTWKVYAGADPTGPTGLPISLTKTTKAAYQTFGAGLHAVSYNPNEVQLVPGQTYFIEFSVLTPPPESPGFNPYVMNDDSYDEGMGYKWTTSGWSAQPTIDLAMTIIEYKAMEPMLTIEPETINKKVYYTGNATPASFTINNGGSDTFNYTVQSNASWLSVTPTAGSCTDETDTITVNFATSGLALGKFTETITIVSPEAINSPRTVTVNLVMAKVPADFDGDTDVDVTDFALLQACFSGPSVPQTNPACQAAKLDEDDDVDQTDAEIFLTCLSGPGILANPYCANP